MNDRGPAFQLTFEERRNYLFVTLKAKSMTEQVASEYFPRLAAEANRLGMDHILFYRDVPNSMPLGALYHKTTDFIELMRGKKIAFVNPYPAIQEEIQFSMMVSANRGANYKLFNSTDEAEQWLIED